MIDLKTLKVGDRVARIQYNTGIKGRYSRRVEFVTVTKVNKNSVTVNGEATFTMGNRLWGTGHDRWSSRVDELASIAEGEQMKADIIETKAVLDILASANLSSLIESIQTAQHCKSRESIERLVADLRVAADKLSGEEK